MLSVFIIADSISFTKDTFLGEKYIGRKAFMSWETDISQSNLPEQR